jgi:hypothetical protein
MPLPTIGTGQQIGDGNVNEIVLGWQGDPQTATVTATLTAAQLLGGMLVGNPSTSAASYTLPTVALLETALGGNSPKVNTAFDVQFINLGTSSGVCTFLVGTGWTIVGRAAVPITTGVLLRARKTAAGAWTLYIVG